MPLDATHDPALKSWVGSANRAGVDFPIQNLPFGVFRRTGSHEAFRGGVAIGDQILDLGAAELQGLASGAAATALATCAQPTLNAFLALGHEAWSALRGFLSEALRAGSPHAVRLRTALVPQQAAEYAVPVAIGDYTDFYASIHHATAVGRLFRPDNPLLPNYKWVPIGYHGRASSIVVSGQSFRRPVGQLMPPGATAPSLGASRRLDYELEVGVIIGTGNALGTRVPLETAEQHVFGVCLLNDWSARDIQAWEYQPLGPFLAKNFATTISPWIVTLEALEPFRAPWTRPADDPQPLAYLDGPQLRAGGALDIRLEVWLETERMRASGKEPERLSQSTFKDSYWTVSQMVAHHTVNGCNLAPGDLLGSGTQSGPTPAEAGSLLELSQGGKQPLTLGSGETRTFLADGDRVIFKGWCEKPGFARIGLGEAAGLVLPAA
ncbi:MAG TPA: fumarylacetoacetase [Steroidobacteraceae bacterium]|nr:fumarylacetoacetase [Steroidobacteraceae bacterium]